MRCANKVSYYVPHGHSNWGRDEYREHLVPCGLTGPYGEVADCGEHPGSADFWSIAAQMYSPEEVRELRLKAKKHAADPCAYTGREVVR